MAGKVIAITPLMSAVELRTGGDWGLIGIPCLSRRDLTEMRGAYWTV